MFLRSVIQLTSLYLVPWFACMALGMTVEPGTFLAVQAILSLAVTAVPLPGAVGASEGSFISLYRLILGADQTFSVMMLSRGISFYAMLAVSGCVTAVLQFDRRFRRER